MSGVGGCPVCDVDSDDATKGAWWLGLLAFAIAAPSATECAATIARHAPEACEAAARIRGRRVSRRPYRGMPNGIPGAAVSDAETIDLSEDQVRGLRMIMAQAQHEDPAIAVALIRDTASRLLRGKSP